MKNIKRVAAITIAGAGLALAGAGVASAHDGPQAQGAAVQSPGVVSGNVVQAPIHVPVNVCGNTVSVIGLLNPVFGNACLNK
ncbi:chaplin [Streptomyces sp. NPDC057555]|uniref:chaplin n=1 Tax=Streptomyces sp. NPDC057555 TaxID=3346166 RepID=UPI00368AA788